MSAPGREFLPYVGITGITHSGQQNELFDVAMDIRPDALGYTAMFGVLTDKTTQHDDVQNAAGRGLYPVGEDIRFAGLNEDSGLTTMYVHCDVAGVTDPVSFVKRIRDRTYTYRLGIKLDGLDWLGQDQTDVVTAIAAGHEHQGLILGVNVDEMMKHDPDVLRRRIAELPINYFSIDGIGQSTETAFDVWEQGKFVNAVKAEREDINLAVSGGLNEYNLIANLSSFLYEYGNVSVSAGSRLRSGAPGEARLNVEAAKRFMHAWHQLVVEYS